MSAVATRYVEAAGGIIYRKRNIDSANTCDFKKTGNQISDDDFELCLVYRPKYDDWSWPKGKNEENESYRHTAVREVGEETGYAVTLGPHIAQIEYPLDHEGKKQSTSKNSKNSSSPQNNQPTVIKRIHYWMMRGINESTASKRLPSFGPIKPAKRTEISNVLWLTPSKARKKLTHDSDREVLDAFLERLHTCRARYSTLILVRHGKAESRKTWQGSEATRPITPLGSAASYALARELACYAPNKILSSPWKRCVETIGFFASDCSMKIEEIPELTEDYHEKNPQDTLNVLIDTIAQLVHCDKNDNYATTNTTNTTSTTESASENATTNSENSTESSTNSTINTTAMCLHRPIIGSFFEYLRKITNPKAHKRILSMRSPYMPTGSAIVLHIINTPKGARIIDIESVMPIVY